MYLYGGNTIQWCSRDSALVGAFSQRKLANSTNQNSLATLTLLMPPSWRPRCETFTSTSVMPAIAGCQSELAISQIKTFVTIFQIRFYMRANSFYPEVELNFISVFWPHLPNGLQAAYEVVDRDEIRFFKGNTSNYFSVSMN